MHLQPRPNLDLATTLGSLSVGYWCDSSAGLDVETHASACTRSNQQGLAIVRQIPWVQKSVLHCTSGRRAVLGRYHSQSIQTLAKLETPLKEEELASGAFASQFSQLMKKDANKG